MEQLCKVHRAPFNLREGVGKNGKPYSFWSDGKKNSDGSWCSERPEEPTTNAGKFECSIDELAVREKANDKDHAIAKAVALKGSLEYYAGLPKTTAQVIATADELLAWLEA